MYVNNMGAAVMNSEVFKYPYEAPDMIFGFLEDEDDSSMNSYMSSVDTDGAQYEEDFDNIINDYENKAFWDSQEKLLQAALYRTTTIETKIRQATKNALKECSNTACVNCSCKMVSSACKSCTQKEISEKLRGAGFNCVVCKAKWRSSPEIIAGEHTYMEVMQNSVSKGKVVKVIIELNFKAEFEMTRACDEYNQLICKLPEVFVGKIERLQKLVKIVCCASNKCMKQRKMHIAPWRKQRYMQAKWQGTPLPHQVTPSSIVVEQVARLPKQRASMLTSYFLVSSPGMHFKQVKVV